MSQLFAEPDLPVRISIAQQIREAERELAFRISIYPRRIRDGKLRQDQADRQIACQRAIIETLKRVQEGGPG